MFFLFLNSDKKYFKATFSKRLCSKTIDALRLRSVQFENVRPSLSAQTLAPPAHPTRFYCSSPASSCLCFFLLLLQRASRKQRAGVSAFISQWHRGRGALQPDRVQLDPPSRPFGRKWSTTLTNHASLFTGFASSCTSGARFDAHLKITLVLLGLSNNLDLSTNHRVNLLRSTTKAERNSLNSWLHCNTLNISFYANEVSN